MELKVGGVYRTRGGAKVKITKLSTDTLYPYCGKVLGDSVGILQSVTYTKTGAAYLNFDKSVPLGEDDSDIVALWKDEKVTTSLPAKYNEDERDRLVNTKTPDAVFQPSHYTRLYPEPITVINAWGLNFNLGNAVKYISRSGHKGGNTAEQDLSKAKRYIEIELERLRREKAIESGEATRTILVETL